MSLTLAAALLSATSVLPSCSWDKPGQNPYMGDVVSAVDRYTDIPKNVRDALKRKMSQRKYDDIATIKRDDIVGNKNSIYTNLRDMHFGPGNICKSITRAKWTNAATERGLVYCEKEHCIIVPTVCRNVSRVTRKIVDDPLEFDTAAGPAKEEPASPESPVAAYPSSLNTPLDFETAAGPTVIVPPSASIPESTFNGFTPQIPNFPSSSPASLIPFTPAIPEPSSLLMFLCGLGLLNFKKSLFSSRTKN